MIEQTLQPSVAQPAIFNDKNRKLAVVLSGIVLIGLVTAVAWLVLNLNNNRTTPTGGTTVTSSGVIDATSTSRSVITVPAAQTKPFELKGKVYNPFTDQEATVTYAGEVLDAANVSLIQSDAVGAAAQDLLITTGEYELSVQVQWDAIDTFLANNANKTTINNNTFPGLFRLDTPDVDTTNQYTYLSNLRSANCDVEPEAGEQCADSYVRVNNEASLLIRCQVAQVTGLSECDRVVASLKVSL